MPAGKVNGPGGLAFAQFSWIAWPICVPLRYTVTSLSTSTETDPAPVPAGTVKVLRRSRSPPTDQPAVPVGAGGTRQPICWPNGALLVAQEESSNATPSKPVPPPEATGRVL